MFIFTFFCVVVSYEFFIIHLYDIVVVPINISIPQTFENKQLEQGGKRQESMLKEPFFISQGVTRKVFERNLFMLKAYAWLSYSSWRQWVRMILEQVAGATLWPGTLPTARELNMSGHWNKLVNIPVV